ncbi:MAG: hypothetical protein Q9M32_02900 [Sulfurimonas sp.]|nr:hypothetical protein [Sulfurimonas sp.]MDQ7059701.1 hypothetical protein [Sulfurimonas sp.]
MHDEYSQKMIEAYIGKEEKTLCYQLAFERFNINGVATKIETMRQVGGYHQWVVWVYAICATLIIAGFSSVFIIPALAF